MAKKDHSGVKFEVAEALGEWMNALFLKQREDSQLEYDFIHHKDHDGMASVTLILKDEGINLIEQPKLRVPQRPSLFKKLKALKKYINLTKKIDLKWKVEREDITGIPQTFIRATFSPDQTQSIEERAKELGASENSYLLWAIDEATSEVLLKEGSQRKWISPLNMRQADGPKIVLGNYVASIINNLEAGKTTPADIHQKIKAYLKDEIHWGSFIYSNMAKYIGFKGTLKVAKNIKEVGTGVFSHLGHWPGSAKIEGNLEDSPYVWRAVPAPSSQILPVASTCWVWKNRMSLCLQIHPSVSRDPMLCQEVMSRWILKLNVEGEVETQLYWWKDFPECPKELIRS